ncbi:MAG: Yip1 family protein [Methylococcales bacterium]|nr:Yip1 family protein [Methylococcales bacterium]
MKTAKTKKTQEEEEYNKRGAGGIGVIILTAILYVISRFIIEIKDFNDAIKLPLLIIAGLSILIVLLAILTMSFWSLGLTNKDQALGLPEGSIRAVIALALVVIFSILAVFLYSSLSNGGEPHTITGWSSENINKYIADHPALINIDKKEIVGSPEKYNFTYTQPNSTESNDFAKQLLVLLGTLMTSVTSFYLGSRTSPTAVSAQALDNAQPLPLLRSVTPKEAKKEDNGGVVKLTMTGENLSSIKKVRIVNGDKEIIADHVLSNDSEITCDVKVDEESVGEWDVSVGESSESSASLPKALKIV